ncbi:MAG: T9SS type A sorting domain-containing protein [Chitinophagaceae bacterium]
MKALVCNSGEDFGNPGPDYTFGFGRANFIRAEEMLSNNRYVSANISPGPDHTIPVNVPSGTALLKVMLYWCDPPAAPVAAQTLVNNLDLTVITPSAATVFPLILDTVPSLVKNNAYNGIDNINNIEQVVIKNPPAGSYTIHVSPTAITQNPSQDYFIVYDLVPAGTSLTTPMGGEAYQKGENVMVQWDSYGDPANEFTLEFSSDNGSNWTTLRNNISGDRRQYFYTGPNDWFVVPAVTTDQARVRISRNGTGFSSTSLPFVIHDTLFCSLSAVQCEGYFSIDWTAVPGATGYEVMMLQGTEMNVIATVSPATLNYTVGGLNKDSVYWMSVRPLIGSSNSPGRRGLAVSRKPNNGTCAGSISDNDIKLDTILSPARSGRLLTSTALGNSVPVTVRIRNLDDAPTPGNINVSYTLNGGAPVNEVLVNPSIAAGGTLVHTFGTPLDLSAAGIYIIEVSVSQAGDPVTSNNMVSKICRQLPNPAISGIDYPAAFLDDFDAAPIQSSRLPLVGLTGLDRYDFVNSNDTGRIRTFINSGMAYSGNRSLTLDGFMYNPAGYTDSLTGTYHLSAFNAATDDIRLDFRYKNHGQASHPANKVWIRGDDTQNWVEAYDLVANQNPVDGSYKFTSSIELSDLLQNAVPAQNFSSSFQVRWGQYGKHMAADDFGGSGYTFDDVRLYKVTDDMQMLAIDTPVVNSCGLSSTTPVRVIVRNSRNSLVNTVPVMYRVNGGGWVNENIPSIPANDTVQYTFSTPADLSAPGTYFIEAQVDYPSDTYDVNDTTSTTVTNTPVITVTDANAYLQDFEIDNGYWYTTGTSSWEYGTPASYKINRAASGSRAWKTRLSGNYNDNEVAILYSPCYDISAMTSPSLSFSVALDLEDCGGSLCDGAYVEYSTDGRTWARLGTNGQGTNWYNKAYGGNNLWSVQNYQRWHVATIPLTTIPVPVAQLTALRFRFVVTADPAVNREGIAIDDIHIYSNPYGIYDQTGPSPVVNQAAVSGSGWFDFKEGVSNKLIASVNPNGHNMGSTDVQSYIHTGPVRTSNLQYYHNRNITIKPSNVNLADSAMVRFYFLDSETETLINATGCGICTKPTMAYELGVTKYSDPNDANEDGTLANNSTGIYQFIRSSNTRIVPFDKGYYASFKVKDFSEFWLNNGWLNGITPLPLKLLSFTARKTAGDQVMLEWRTTEEVNVNRFEVEVAKGNAEYQLNRFSPVGQLPASNQPGEQRYVMPDLEPNKTGVRYYRLKMIDQDGSFTYSPVRPLSFTGGMDWQVYPNPSEGLFNLVIQENEGAEISVTVYDAAGRVVRRHTMIATGFIQKYQLDLRGNDIAKGLYVVEVKGENKNRAFRLLKQ